MTKAELIAALASFPDDALISVRGGAYGPDHDRYHESVGEVRPLSLEDDIFLDDDISSALRNGTVVVSIDTE